MFDTIKPLNHNGRRISHQADTRRPHHRPDIKSIHQHSSRQTLVAGATELALLLTVLPAEGTFAEDHLSPDSFFQGGDWKASAEMHLTGWPCFILQCVRVQLQGWINQQLCPLEEISLKRGPIFWSFNTPGRWEHYSKSPKQRCKCDRWERDPPWGLEDKWKTGTVFNPFK